MRLMMMRTGPKKRFPSRPVGVVHLGAGVWFVTHDEANHRHAAQSKPSGVNFLLPMYVTAG